MNGQASLPYGGYLGVGFLSNFDYDFYSPSPVRSGNSYQYSQGVRYDLFGSALQAHLTTQVRDIVYLNYYDADENNQLIVPQHQFIWFPNVSWNVPASKFQHYAYGQESQHRNGNTIIVGDYYHIQSTVTYDYYGTDGIYLGQQSITGLYNKPYSVNVPYNFGNYYIKGSTTESGLYPKTDETLNVYYKYVPPIVYYNTSNPYATTYYANGYEYVPNYIAPVVYYAPTYNEYNSGGGYGYDGGTPYSGGNGYSSGAGYSSTSVASRGGYSLYVPQSAYYSKEAQLVAEEGERAEKADEGGFNLGEETRDAVLGKGMSEFSKWALYAEDDTGYGVIIDYGMQKAEGEDTADALTKTGAHFVLGEAGMAAGMAIPVPGLDVVAGFAFGFILNTGFDFLYDKLRRKR